jgi:5'-3' exonuclease
MFPMPYLEVKDGGNELLMRIYQQLLPHFQQYLLLWNPESPTVRPQINVPFLEAIFMELSKSEDYLMRKHQQHHRRQVENAQREADQHIPSTDPSEEYKYQVDNVLNHGFFAIKQNPLHAEYGTDWQMIDCNQPKAVWKAQYYKALFDLDPMNTKEYNEMRQQISTHYLQALMFSIIYYFDGLPSWRWYYPYYAPPCASDIVFALKKYPQINSIPFEQGVPYRPLEQLMLVTAPHRAASILPKKLAAGMHKLSSPILSYFPTKYRANTVFVSKWIRTEVLFLPDPNDALVMGWMETIYPTLSKKDLKKNEITEEPFMYRGKKGDGMKVNHLSSLSQTKIPMNILRK